ncbi:MAG TPA: hypothetical protein ENK57_03875 [Polyangiaceae bacterium]|nr:hypothetical protein [Polyangiaceae bacterium]
MSNVTIQDQIDQGEVLERLDQEFRLANESPKVALHPTQDYVLIRKVDMRQLGRIHLPAGSQSKMSQQFGAKVVALGPDCKGIVAVGDFVIMHPNTSATGHPLSADVDALVPEDSIVGKVEFLEGAGLIIPD